MIAKLIAHGDTRDEATRRGSREALAETEVRGLDTNLPFLRWLVAHPALPRRRDDHRLPQPLPAALGAAAAAACRAVAGGRSASTCRRRALAPPPDLDEPPARPGGQPTSSATVSAPMPGTVIARPRRRRRRGRARARPLVVLEAMKMETPLAAPHAGEGQRRPCRRRRHRRRGALPRRAGRVTECAGSVVAEREGPLLRLTLARPRTPQRPRPAPDAGARPTALPLLGDARARRPERRRAGVLGRGRPRADAAAIELEPRGEPRRRTRLAGDARSRRRLPGPGGRRRPGATRSAAPRSPRLLRHRPRRARASLRLQRGQAGHRCRPSSRRSSSRGSAPARRGRCLSPASASESRRRLRIGLVTRSPTTSTPRSSASSPSSLAAAPRRFEIAKLLARAIHSAEERAPGSPSGARAEDAGGRARLPQRRVCRPSLEGRSARLGRANIRGTIA